MSPNETKKKNVFPEICEITQTCLDSLQWLNCYGSFLRWHIFPLMLLVDKYRPRTLNECDYHQKLSTRLEQLASSNDVPHLLVSGPSGAGKKTRVLAFLRAIFGPGVEKIRTDQKTYDVANKSTGVEVTLISSNYHIELNPSESGYQDKVVVQEVIKDLAQSPSIGDRENAKTFKVVVLNEVDRLSAEAQAGLRRTMELYMRSCRMILCCNSSAHVIPALQSRCLNIRIAAPTVPEISKVLQKVATAEKWNLPPKLAAMIAKKSNRNLRRALLMLETCKIDQYPFQENQKILLPEWEEFLAGLADQILAEQSPKKLLAVRAKLYELLVHCIPPEAIMKKLAITLVELVDNDLKFEVVKWAAFYVCNFHLIFIF